MALRCQYRLKSSLRSSPCVCYREAIVGAAGPIPLDLIRRARIRELKALKRDEYAPRRPPHPGMLQQVLFSPDGRVAHLRGGVVCLFEETHLPLALSLVGMPASGGLDRLFLGGAQPLPVATENVAEDDELRFAIGHVAPSLTP